MLLTRWIVDGTATHDLSAKPRILHICHCRWSLRHLLRSQESVVARMCNMFSSSVGSDWLDIQDRSVRRSPVLGLFKRLPGRVLDGVLQ